MPHRGSKQRAALVRALSSYGDELRARTGSVIVIGPRFPSRDAFHPGVIAELEQREELVRRFRALPVRDRELLFLWYVLGRRVPDIAKTIGVSRVHCYRLHERALKRLLEEDHHRSRESTGSLQARHGVNT
jgi:DNA-directed RNA polymerase specialized sigma24 family protein